MRLMHKIAEEIEIEICGRVQGVLFRGNIKKFADNLGIKGYVLNKEDGSVLLVAQGDKEKLEKLLLWIQSDPGMAKVSGLSYKWRNSDVEYKEFTIKKEGNFIIDKAKSFLNLGKLILGKQKNKIPVHVAIIPDGNRRWAEEKGLAVYLGHYKSAGGDNLESLIKEAKNLGIKYLTFWGFSTENWKRSSIEKNAIFDLVLKNVRVFREKAKENKVRFRHIGRKDRLPEKLLEEMRKLEEETKGFRDFNIQLCLDYGGRDEIVRAVNQLLASGVKEVSENVLMQYLDSKDIPDPDLIIRTSGEQRLSGFMPFQSVYAEIYFADVNFPDFTARELRKAVEDFGKRERRLGGNRTKVL